MSKPHYIILFMILILTLHALEKNIFTVNAYDPIKVHYCDMQMYSTNINFLG